MKHIIRPAIKGLLTFIPGSRLILPNGGTGGTNEATYCYDVWLKHLTLLWENGMRAIPDTLAELGPGDSLGIGLSAMLCGTNNYYALDVVEHSNPEINLKILNELVALFQSRAARPTKGWPDFDDYLNEDLFPDHILTDELLEKTLSPKRVAAIRGILESPPAQRKGMTIQYMVPWSDANVIRKNSVDAIISHSVLEHVVDLDRTYPALHAWMKPGGRMSHQIDFGSHGLSKEWNGYRRYSEFLWKIVLGRRPYLINRQPHSVHIDLMRQSGFSVTCDMENYAPGGIRRSDLSEYWRDITDDDLTCSGAFVQSIK